MNTLTESNNSHCISVCNSLLRGEISAVETYNEVISKFATESEIAELIRIRDEHMASADLLRNNIRTMGGEPDEGSGAWGSFATTVQSIANFFGENSAMGSLRQGEKIGRGEYESALGDDGVMEACKALYKAELIPKIDAHIATLDRLISS